MQNNNVQKAVKGNQAVMRALYDKQKSKVMTLCQALLLDERIAEHAITHIYKKAFEELIAGRITSEAEFHNLVIRKTVLHCRANALKKSNRAFNLPANSNFYYSYEPSKMDFSGSPEEIILKNLPPLLRFIYVLTMVADYSSAEISKLLHITPNAVEKALEAEPINIERISAVAAQNKTFSQAVTMEKLHKKLVRSAVETRVPAAVDAVVRLNIEELCKPAQKNIKRKQRGLLAGLIAALVVIAIAVVILPGREDNANIDLDNADPDFEATTQVDESLTESDEATGSDAGMDVEATYYADIAIAGYGTITVALDGNSAPETVDNFVSLAQSGFYEDLTFHRIIDGFMMQGGDPNGDGTGGSDTTITGEFSANGIENNLSHTRGAISMARSSDYNSASSQFFIVQEDNTESLDGQYACFGYVTEGMDIVDAICEAAEPVDDNGLIAAEEQPIITSITIREASEENSGSSNLAEVADNGA